VYPLSCREKSDGPKFEEQRSYGWDYDAGGLEGKKIGGASLFLTGKRVGGANRDAPIRSRQNWGPTIAPPAPPVPAPLKDDGKWDTGEVRQMLGNRW